MSVSSLAQHFDDLIATSEDVEQLNRAILQLAMHGNLVEQDNTKWDETLVRDTIAHEIKTLIEKGKLTKPSNVLPISKNEIPKDKPTKWICLRLGECLGLVNGRAYNQSELLDNGTPVIRIQNLNGGDRWYYSNLNLSPEKYCESGDLLFAWSASFGPYIWDGPRAIFHYHIWRLELTSIIDKKFAYYLLQYITERVKAASHGLAMLHITKTKMENWVIVLPPLVEQQRIVARMEELFAQTRALANELDHSQIELDGLNKSVLSHLLGSETPEEFNQHWAFVAAHFDLLFQAPEHVAPLRQSILVLAVRGKLTRREVGDESAKELLKRIKTEKDKTGRKSSLLQISDDEAPFDLPDGWEWVRLGELVKKIGAGSTPKGGKEVYETEGTKFIRSQNVYNDGLRLDDVVYISDNINEKMSGTIVKAKDILLNITGASIARCALVPDDFDSANVNQHVMIIRLVEPEIRKFIHTCMISPYIYHLIMSVQVGMSREGLSIGKLEKFVLPFPPLAEQERIVKRVEQLLSLCDALEARLQSAEEERGRLVRAVMAGVGD